MAIEIGKTYWVGIKPFWTCMLEEDDLVVIYEVLVVKDDLSLGIPKENEVRIIFNAGTRGVRLRSYREGISEKRWLFKTLDDLKDCLKSENIEFDEEVIVPLEWF